MSTLKKAFGKPQVQQAIEKKNVFSTTIQAQCASAVPPLGPLLGKFGLNINAFCKQFNEKTKSYKRGVPLPVTVRIKPDRSYDIDFHTPSLIFYLMQAAGITKQKVENETKSGEITLKHIYEIAKIKHTDPYSKLQILDFDVVVNKTISLAAYIGLELVTEIDPVKYKEFLDKRAEFLEQLAKELEEKEKLKFQRV